MMRIILILLVISINCNSQVKPIVEIEAGYCEYSASFASPAGSNIPTDISSYPMYSNILLGAKYKNISFKQTVENLFGYENGYSFSPYQIRYITGLYYELKKFTFTYEHMCFHPISAKANSRFNHLYFFEAYDKLSIKLKLL